MSLPSIAPYPMPRAHELPASRPDWSPDPARAVLLVHDMQRYFLAPFPPSVRDPLVRHCVLLRERCAALRVPVFYTAQPGGMTDEERGLLKDFWAPGMRIGPLDRQIVAEFAPRPADQVLTK